MSEQHLRQHITPLRDINFHKDLQGWIIEQAATYELRYLLAHADDGINWGIVDNGELKLSHEEFAAYSPALREQTLQQLRLFGEAGELYLWRVDTQWYGRLLTGNPDEDPDIVKAKYLLWGTSVDGSVTNPGEKRFVLLADGKEGLRHAPPLLDGFHADTHYLALQLYHYLDYDADGQAYVAASRLAGLKAVARLQNGEREDES